MDELSEAARRLMDRATAEDEPPGEAVEESWGMVVARVQADGVGLTPSPPVASRRWRVWLGAGALVAAIAGWAVLRSPSPAPGSDVAEVPTADPPSPSVVIDPTSPPRSHPAPAPPREDPIALLDRAEALLADDPAGALALLVRHAEIDIDAAQVPRRLALRVRCLCALGRHDDAQHEATAFLDRHGDSALAPDVRAGCSRP